MTADHDELFAILRDLADVPPECPAGHAAYQYCHHCNRETVRDGHDADCPWPRLSQYFDRHDSRHPQESPNDERGADGEAADVEQDGAGTAKPVAAKEGPDEK